MGKFHYPTAEVNVEEISTVSTEHVHLTTYGTDRTNASQNFANQSHTWSHLASSSNDIHVHVYIGVYVACLAILVGILGAILYRKKHGQNLHLCTKRTVNQHLEGGAGDSDLIAVPFEQTAGRDSSETLGDNKADTSATLLLDTSL